MRISIYLPFILVLILCGCSSMGSASKNNIDTKAPLDFAAAKYLRIAQALDPGKGYPRTSNPDGTWKQVRSGDWTSGFFPGTLWYLYEYTGNDALRQQAERWTAGLEKEKANKGTHDLGFMINDSFGQGYRLTRSEAYRGVVLEAARTLSTRFDPKVGAIKSWDFHTNPPSWKYPVIIDNMMNLDMLFWAAKNGGEKRFADIAKQHAATSARYHVRPDGSMFHVIDFDPATGQFVRGLTHQGFNDESAWSRGQAWGIYGFAMTYRETRDTQFLETAQKVADYFVDNLPADAIPYWDFRAPGIPNEPRDASAAAVAASGLLELSTLVQDKERSRRYLETAERILQTLSAPAYMHRSDNPQALLLHSVGHKMAGSEVDMPLSYADYYFVEALMRYRNIKK